MPASDASAIHPWPLVIGAAMVVASLALWRDESLNVRLFHAINAWGPKAPALWSGLSVAGLGIAAWIFLTALAQQRTSRVAQLLWILIVGGLVIHLIKHSFTMPRPLLALGANSLNVVGEALRTRSMPSGHSAMAFAMLALLWRENTPTRGQAFSTSQHGLRLLKYIGWTSLAIGVALSRIAVGAHWPCDVLLGAGLGLVFGTLAAHAWPMAALKRLLMRPPAQRLLALGLAICALAIAATPTVLDSIGLAHTPLEKRLASGYPLAEPLQWGLALLALIGARRWWLAARHSDAGTAPANSSAAL